MDSTTPSATVSKSRSVLIVGVLLIVGFGVTLGLILSKSKPGSASSTTGSQMINTASEVGSTDTKTFRDNAKGTLEAGGINGEGTHHLSRPENPNHPVYLVSSIVDLEEFVGKQVEVWGETIKGQKAGWLMDVGRVKIIE